MKIYMSYWHTGGMSNFFKNQPFSYEAKEFFKISAKLIKKHYGEVHLITDFIGEKELKNVIEWDSINLYLETLPKNYSKLWSLGKIKTINFLCSKKEPFLHIDHDVFLNHKLPEDLLSKGIILQSLDSYSLFNEKRWFQKDCTRKYLATNIISDDNYNCGIIGGNDINFFEQFSTSCLSLVLNEENKNFWLNNNEQKYEFKSYSKSMLLEQYYISVSLDFFNKKPNLLFTSYYNLDKNKANNPYIHLFGPKKYTYHQLYEKIKNNYL